MKTNKNNYKINYFVADILNSDSKKYSDLEIENIIKLFCLSRINKYYNNFNIYIMNTNTLNELFLLENVNGLVKENNIFLKRENVLELRNGKIDIIRTIFHELEHVKQNYMLEHNDISYRTYLTLMDEIVSYKIGNNYYKDNYEYIFTELDARMKAEFDLYDYLSEYCPKILDNEFDNIIDNVLQCEKDSLVNYRIVNGTKYDLEELFDTIIYNDISLLKQCPILYFYYNQDGSKITLGELIKRKDSIYDNDTDLELIYKVKKLDNFIIKNRSGSIENLQKDIGSILELDDESNNEILLDLNNKINNYDTCNVSLLQTNTFKNRICKTKIAAEKYAIKVYNLFNR